jgi:hypothetical protein
MRDHGQTLFDNGYRIVAVKPGDKAATGENKGKAPVYLGWQRFGHQQTQADIDQLVRKYPACGIGIITAWTPAIDIDVLDPALAAELERLAIEKLGASPVLVRIGMWPKRLLLFQTEAPFRKITGAGFVMPGDDPTAPGYKGHRIEVLGDGQHCVAYGIHPITDRPYDWPSTNPLEVPRNDLPILTEEMALRFLDDAQVAMMAAGAILRHEGAGDRKAGRGRRTDKPKGEGGGQRQDGGNQAGDGQGQKQKQQRNERADLDLIREALRHINIQDQSYDEWIRFGYAIKGALGEAGRPLFVEWSAPYTGNEPEILDQKWDSFSPTGIGAGTIFWHAKQNGWAGPPPDHAGAYRYEGPEPFYPDTAVPLDEAERLTRQAIDGFLQRTLEYPSLPVSQITGNPPLPPVAAMRIGTGIGKTEAVLDGLANQEWAGKSIYYCVPEHALANQVAERFSDRSEARGGPPGMVFRGRQRMHPSGDPMCRKADLVALVTGMGGGSVRSMLCERAAEGGRKAQYCEHHQERGGDCRYMEQVLDGRPGVRFMPHNYLTLPKPEGIPKPDLVVIDESFFQTCLRGVEGPLKSRPFILPDQLRGTRDVPMKGGFGGYDVDATEELSKLSGRAADLLEGDRLSPSAFLAAGFTAADAHRAASLEYSRREASDISPAMTAAAQRERLQGGQGRDVSRFGRFWKILARELANAPDRDAFHGIVAGEMETDAGTVAGFFLRWSVDLKAHVREAPVLVLDATADVTILRRFLPDLLDPIGIEALWPHVEVVQATDTVSAKSRLVPSAGAAPEELQRRANNREELRQLAEVEVAKAGGPREDGSPVVLVITYKGAVQIDDDTPLIEPVPGADFAWLNGVRGKDHWRNVKTLIVVGRTQPKASTIEAMTAALFFADAEPIRSVGGDKYGREVRGYRMADKSHWGVETDCLPDPRAEAVRWQICEAELVQGIGRPRPARRTADRPLKVLVQTSIPLPITVNRLTTTHEMKPTVVEVLAARGAVPVKPWADLAEAYPGLFVSADAARMAIGRLNTNKPLYELLIGVCSELARTVYRRPRPGQRATTGVLLYDPARADPAVWLAEHLPGAEVFEPKQAKTKPKPAEARPAPRTLADLHARLAGMSFIGFAAHDVRTGTGKPFGRRRALVIRCGTVAPPMFTPAGLVPAAVAATPFDDLFVPEFRVSGRLIRYRSRVVSLDIPFDDPVPASRPLRPAPLRLVHPDDASINNETRLPNNYGAL